MKLPALAAFLLSPMLLSADFEARIFTAPDGGKMPYQLLKPKHYDASKKYPLLVFLHGAGERGDDNKAQLKWGASLFTREDVREKFPAFVLMPQCPKELKWVEIDWSSDTPVAPASAGTTQKLLMGMIEFLGKEFSLDSDRHYLGGLSMGGYGTWDFITRYPNQWAAAVPICGGGDKSKATAAKSVPVWAFHGDADTVVKPIRTAEMVDALRAANAPVAYTVYAGIGHDSWIPALAEKNLLPWLFSQRLGQPAQKMELAASSLSALGMPPENALPGVGPVQMSDWFKKVWMKRRTEFSIQNAMEKNAVVFLGDSITQGWNNLDKNFPGMKIANRGISGDTSRGVLYRLREDVLSLNPKAVSLLIGTNDLSMGAEPAQIATNIKAIIGELQKQNPSVPIILNRVMPRGPAPGKFPDKIRALNQMIDTIASEDPRLSICDTWSIFDDGKGICKKEEFPDMLHLNAAAYAKWKTALSAIFEKLKL